MKRLMPVALMWVSAACLGTVAGPDKRLEDGGSPRVDAGGGEAQADASVRVIDAGVIDAGTNTESGRVDGGRIDSGTQTIDAGRVDAGPITPTDAGALSEPFTFLVYGDTRDGNHACEGNDIHQKLVARMAAEPASMVFHVGDMVTGYDDSTTWARNSFNCGAGHAPGNLKALIAPLQNKTPAPGLPTFFFPVIGNHDDAWGDCSNGHCWYPDPSGDGVCSVFSKELVRQLVPNHRSASYFQDADNTSNMPAFASDDDFYTKMCSTSTSVGSLAYPTYFYYSVNYRNTHFVVLRVNSDIFDLEDCGNCGAQNNYDNYYNIHQLHWLRHDLAKARATAGIQNIVMFLHAPMFSTSDGHGPVASTNAIALEASKYGAKIVFSGHSHVYERSVPIRVDAANTEGVQDNAAGTTYIVTGGGGSAPHGFNTSAWFDAFRADGTWQSQNPTKSGFHYIRVTVNGAQMQAQVVDQGGTVIDAFTR